MADYTKSNEPVFGSRGVSARIRREFENIEAAVAARAKIDSPVFTGNPQAPTPGLGNSSESLATTEFVANTAFSAALPAQSGNNGKFLQTDGTNASWEAHLPDKSGNEKKYLRVVSGQEEWADDDFVFLDMFSDEAADKILVGPPVFLGDDAFDTSLITFNPSLRGNRLVFGAGLFVASRNSITTDVRTSPDGITWTHRTTTIPSSNHDKVIATNGVDEFLCIRATGVEVSKSSDAISWSAATDLPGAAPVNTTCHITHLNGVYLALAAAAGVVYRSDDFGTSWTTEALPAPFSSATIIRLFVVNDRFLIMAGDPTYMYSETGLAGSWTSETAPISVGTNTVVGTDGTLYVPGYKFVNHNTIVPIGKLNTLPGGVLPIPLNDRIFVYGVVAGGDAALLYSNDIGTFKTTLAITLWADNTSMVNMSYQLTQGYQGANNGAGLHIFPTSNSNNSLIRYSENGGFGPKALFKKV